MMSRKDKDKMKKESEKPVNFTAKNIMQVVAFRYMKASRKLYRDTNKIIS